MSQKDQFVKFISEKVDENEMPDDVKEYWEILKEVQVKDKPLFTDNGKKVLLFLQNNLEKNLWKARDIAEKLNMSSRSVSGAMRKLVTDNFVNKMGQDPAVYAITKKGKDIKIENN